MCILRENNFFNILENADDKAIFELLATSGASYAQLES